MIEDRRVAKVDVSLLLRLHNEGKTESEIARLLGVGRAVVKNRLVAANVPRRTNYAANMLRRKRTFEIDPVLDLIDGLLLGDASIEYDGVSEGRLELTQRKACVEWLEEVQVRFSEVGVKSLISNRGSIRGYQLRTGKYATFSEQRKRWYPNGKKIVPRNVQLSPESIAHWYFGDGVVENNGYRISLCTDGFEWEDVRFLIQRMYVLYGLEMKIYPHQNKPRISLQKKKSRISFIGLIRPYALPCFLYKTVVKP